MKKVTIFTGCHCVTNPGDGAWSAILKSEDNQKILSGFEPNTTNMRMHLTAVVEGLLALRKPCDVTIISHAEYVKGVIMEKWKSRKNKDILARLYEVKHNHEIHIRLEPAGEEVSYMRACAKTAQEVTENQS